MVGESGRFWLGVDKIGIAYGCMETKKSVHFGVNGFGELRCIA